MTRHDDRKSRIRARMAATGEPYTVAARTLTAEDEVIAADAVHYDPVQDGAVTTSTIPSGVMRAMGMVSGVGPDCFELLVKDPTANGGPSGRLAMIARPFIHDGAPALLVESVDIVERHGLVPGLWWNAMSIDLGDLGWCYATEGSETADWRVEVTPVVGRPSAPVRVRVHDGVGYTLFDGPVLLPPAWYVRAKHLPSVLVVAGPCAGALVPAEPDEETVVELLDTADLIAAQIRVVVLAAAEVG
ncbi:MAG: hypothetical protein JXA67_12085 [Micromonosporaceae bacterium]|nr:hypothetical protein [Micromonosporaceae bacterium]